MPAPRLVVIGNPENRRVAFFLEAARRLGAVPPVVLSYLDWLEGRIELTDHLDGSTLLRIDSCGEQARVDRLFCERGRQAAGSSEPLLSEAEFLGGRIGPSRLWYLGFCEFLEQCGQALRATGAQAMNAPADIRLLFDKAECQRYLRGQGLPVPEPVGVCRSYAELRELLDRQREDRVFVKLRHSSSASGVLAWQEFFAANDPQRRLVNVMTTAELVREGDEIRLYNNLQPRRYSTEPPVAEIVDRLGPQGWYVERMIQKPALAGRTFDLRVLLIAGEIRHIVVRTSRGPITNLHLGNQRGDLNAMLALCPPDQWDSARDTLARAAAAFPESLYLGVDLTFDRDFQHHYILEINAFGDLLPNLYDRGDDPCTAELRAVL